MEHGSEHLQISRVRSLMADALTDRQGERAHSQTFATWPFMNADVPFILFFYELGTEGMSPVIENDRSG